ncbi:MAG: GPR endopeptidase [Bacteroidales bacterium]|nr:GPR endopeptidase [Bacteroidales bacterium]
MWIWLNCHKSYDEKELQTMPCSAEMEKIMGNFQIRTDLALEARETVSEADGEMRGIRVEEYYKEKEDIRVTKVVIDTKNAAKTMGKPMGTYVTMEAPAMVEPDDGYHKEISDCFAEELLRMIPDIEKELSVLVVGLGNREVTADALGPQVVDNLFITRHVVKAYGTAAYNCSRMNLVSSIEPGVMAKTGMETAEIVKGVIEQTLPDVLIVVDALAARSTKRLNRTIQISNTGIQPGSGVGNHRNALTQESLGVPVIAVGVPTVVDAATIVGDALEKITGDNLNLNSIRYHHEMAFAELNNMYMTGKDIDAVIKRVSFTVSEGINMAMEKCEKKF